MSTDSSRPQLNAPRTLFALAGVFFVVCAILYNPLTAALAVKFARTALGRPDMEIRETTAVLRAELAFAVAAAICFGVYQLVGRVGALEVLFRRGAAEKLVLIFLALAVPLTALEIALRPFSDNEGKETSLFVRDAELGWRLRPSTTQPWGGVTVTTNAQGLRGPEVALAKPQGTKRILWLGDSVTFGYLVPDWRDTFPFLVAARLDSGGIQTESINAGVGGYSPWQEDLWLRRNGVRYDPDVVVVGFVLNDVTEKFHLVKYGGDREGRQLRDSYTTWVDYLVGHSALAYQVRNLTLEFKAKRRLGSDVRLGAIQQQALDVQTLISHPDGENVRLAWEVTLENLDRIRGFCAENEMQLIVVAFPFAMQLEDPQGAGAPQRRLTGWASEAGVKMVDLLPVLAGEMEARGGSPDAFFLDHDHLTEEGHRVVAEVLADEIALKRGTDGAP
jgi:lysophospholipase L1-like esterase